MWLLNPWVYLGIIFLSLHSFTITGIWHLPKYDHFVCFRRQNICFSLCICFYNIPTHSYIFLLYNIHGTSYFSVDVDLIQLRWWVVCWDWPPNSKHACSFCNLTPESGGREEDGTSQRQSVDYSTKSGEKHGWHVCANLPKNWVCFRKLHSWHWGCFITILELTRLPSEDVPLKRGGTGHTLFSTGGSSR